MKIFLDANVIISVLNKEYPLFTYSSRILSLAGRKDFKVYTSPLCLAIAFYFAEKKFRAAVAKEKIRMLADHIDIAPVDAHSVTSALDNKKVKDFEDGLEYYSALSVHCDSIVTEDTKDFYFSDIAVMNSEHFCSKYMRPR